MKKPPLTATSFSRYKVHATCPRQAKYKFVDKLPEPKGPALERGNEIHVGIERYLRGQARALPQDAGTCYGPALTKLYADLKKKRPEVELEIAVDARWQVVEWFSPATYFRAKLDAAWLDSAKRQLHLFDHKTGKFRPEEHVEQLETYVLVAPARWPGIEEVVAAMLYTDLGMTPSPSVFTNLKALLPRLRKKWTAKLAPLLKDRTFKATPGPHCRWCAYSGKKGGPCEAG